MKKKCFWGLILIIFTIALSSCTPNKEDEGAAISMENNNIEVLQSFQGENSTCISKSINEFHGNDGHIFVKNDEKIDAIILSNDDMKNLSQFFFFKVKLSSCRISLDDIDQEYKVGKLRKVVNKSGEVLIYNKYCDDWGNVIFLFSDAETFTPEFILDYYRTIIDYSDEKRCYESFDETYKEYRDLILNIDLK